jgi:hypothetical protein
MTWAIKTINTKFITVFYFVLLMISLYNYTIDVKDESHKFIIKDLKYKNFELEE